MPELPEVENLKLYLSNIITDLKIKEVIVNDSSLRYSFLSNAKGLILNSYVLNIKRRARYLIFNLSTSYSILIHLGMAGKLTVESYNYNILKHDHLAIKFNNSKQLILNDSRKFGSVRILPTFSLEKLFERFGPEPLTEDLNVSYLKKELIRRKKAIKLLLLDNKVISGVGNIYSSESLFHARVHPNKQCYKLKDSEIHLLVISLKVVLQRAIFSRGTSFKDFINPDKQLGKFQNELFVYKRKGKECLVCYNIISTMKHNCRTTYYCKVCQNY